MDPRTKMLEDQIKWLQGDIKRMDKGEQSGNKGEAITLLREKQKKLRELVMGKGAKNVLTDEEAKKDKKLLTDKEEKDQKKLLTDKEEKDQKGLVMDKSAKGLDTKDVTQMKKHKEEKEKEETKKTDDKKKKVPFGWGQAKKAKALKILRDAGLVKGAEVDKDVYQKLHAAEVALKDLWSALSSKGDPQASVDQQREIEALLQKFAEWHRWMTG